MTTALIILAVGSALGWFARGAFEPRATHHASMLVFKPLNRKAMLGNFSDDLRGGS